MKLLNLIVTLRRKLTKKSKILFVIVITLCLYNCESKKIIIKENKKDVDNAELVEFFRKKDKEFDSKTFVIFEKIRDSIKNFKLIEKDSNVDLLLGTLETHTSHLYPGSYIYTLDKKLHYSLYIDEIIYNVPIEKLQSYRYITITYDQKLNKYIIHYSNYRKGFI